MKSGGRTGQPRREALLTLREEEDEIFMQSLKIGMTYLASILTNPHSTDNYMFFMSYLAKALEVKESEKERRKMLQEMTA